MSQEFTDLVDLASEALGGAALRANGIVDTGFLALAGAQPTAARRARATGLVCLGAGAGIIAGELRHVRGCDIVQRAGGVLVVVSGRRARSVPVLERDQQPLLAAAAFAGGVLVPLNTRFTAYEAAALIRRAEAVAVLAFTDFLGRDYLA